MFKMAKTYWVWTDLTESMHPDRKSGTMIFGNSQTVPRSWVEKGYVIDSSEYVRDGQVDMFDLLV